MWIDAILRNVISLSILLIIFSKFQQQWYIYQTFHLRNNICPDTLTVSLWSSKCPAFNTQFTTRFPRARKKRFTRKSWKSTEKTRGSARHAAVGHFWGFPEKKSRSVTYDICIYYMRVFVEKLFENFLQIFSTRVFYIIWCCCHCDCFLLFQKKIIKPSIPIVATSIIEPLIENQSLKAYSLASETKESEQSVNNESRPTDITGISIMRTSFEADDSHGEYILLLFIWESCFDLVWHLLVTAEFQKLCEIRPEKSRKRRQVCRNSRVHPLTYEETNQALNLNNFGHIDFRNCRCLSVIDCIFMKLQQHIENIGKFLWAYFYS